MSSDLQVAGKDHSPALVESLLLRPTYAVLEKMPALKSILKDPVQREVLGRDCVVQDYAPGDKVYTQGQLVSRSRAAIYVLRGTVSIRLSDGTSSDVHEGGFFGDPYVTPPRA